MPHVQASCAVMQHPVQALKWAKGHSELSKLVCKCTSSNRHGGQQFGLIEVQGSCGDGGMSFLHPLCEPPLQLGGSPPGG